MPEELWTQVCDIVQEARIKTIPKKKKCKNAKRLSEEAIQKAVKRREAKDKGCPFHYRGLECKSRKLRNTWSNREIWPWSTKWSRAKANRVFQENAQVIANTLFQQHKRRLYTWTSPDGQYQNQIDYILCSQRWRSSIQSTKTRPGADCGSEHELLITKFRLKLKKVGKTARHSGMTSIKSRMIIQWKWEIDLRA